jgi:hypothetical protein
MARVLYVTTAYQAGPIQFPDWVRDMSYVDVFVLNPYRYELEPTDVPTVRESFSYTSETGISKNGQPFLVFRAYNETLRRSFRELLRWGSWDALIIDGLVSVAPLVGDHGLDFPRGLSWVVYRERPEDEAKLNDDPRWFQLRRRIVKSKLNKWHRLISEKSAEVVKENRPKLRTLYGDLDEAS